MASRIAHHIDFPDYSADELFEIAQIMANTMHYRFDTEGAATLRDYIVRRMRQPRFSNARSIRNAIDRARLRMANRLFADRDRPVDRMALETITAQDLRASRVFTEVSAHDHREHNVQSL
jgi:glycerol-3-phosphate dehydrogenase